MDLVVVGAGPAGLTTALAARRRGLSVRLFEQGQPDDPRPGTWVLNRNGLQVLRRLGEFTMIAVDRARLEDPTGRVLADLPLRESAVVLRKTLLEELRAMCLAEGVEIHWGQRASGGVRADGDTRGAIRVGRRRYLRGLCAGPPPRPYPLEIWYADGTRSGFDPAPDGRTGFYTTGDPPPNVLECEEKICGPAFRPGGRFLAGDAFACQAPTLSQGCNSALVDGWRVGHGLPPAGRLRTQVLSWVLSEVATRPFPGRNRLVTWLARRAMLQRWFVSYLEGQATCSG